MKLRKTILSNLGYTCVTCGTHYTTIDTWAQCQTDHEKVQEITMENTITTDHDKQLQILDRAITYATATEIPLNEAWKTVNELLTTEVTLGERLQNYGNCESSISISSTRWNKADTMECVLNKNHQGKHQNKYGAYFEIKEG